jgi:hypothetical protein
MATAGADSAPAVDLAVEEYEVPKCKQFAGPIRAAVQVLPKRNSILDQCGRRLSLPAGKLNEDGTEYIVQPNGTPTLYFHCLECDLTDGQPTLFRLAKGTTGIGARHCMDKHDIVSNYLAYTKNRKWKAEMVERFGAENPESIEADPARFCQYYSLRWSSITLCRSIFSNAMIGGKSWPLIPSGTS